MINIHPSKKIRFSKYISKNDIGHLVWRKVKDGTFYLMPLIVSQIPTEVYLSMRLPIFESPSDYDLFQYFCLSNSL